VDHRNALYANDWMNGAALFWINMGGTAEYAGNFVPEDECVVSIFDSTGFL
jgi:hypothetical protein